MISSCRLTQEICSLRHHFVPLLCPLVIATTFIGCSSGNNTPQVPTQPSLVTITQSFSGTLTVNGAQTHSFTVDRAGTVSAQVKSLSDQAATLGVSLGTYNGSACTIIISKTDAVLNTAVAGTAQSTGQFCVWVNDVGKLTSGLDYTIDVTHY
jgi:hypothetical protein